MIKVATDSACDLPAEWYKDYDITVVPINIQFGTETYQDGVDIDRATFYRKIEDTGTLPTTSQPSAGQFETYYRKMMAEGAEDIISIHVTGKLSGTIQSAQLATDMLAGQVRVHPFDTEAGTAAQGFMCVEATRMARDGHSVAEILARLHEIRERLSLSLVVKDLRYAQMSGRVGRLQGTLASLLNVKPVIVLKQGILDVSERVRTQGKALERMLDVVADGAGTADPVNLAVIHADSPEDGAALMEQARARFHCQESFLVNLTTTLVVHFGPGTLGLVAYRV